MNNLQNLGCTFKHSVTPILCDLTVIPLSVGPSRQTFHLWKTQGGIDEEMRGVWEADREPVSCIHLIYGHIYNGKRPCDTHCRQIRASACTHTRAASRKKWGYLAVSALLIFFPQFSSVICLEPTPSLHLINFLSFCFVLQSSHQKKKMYLDEQ